MRTRSDIQIKAAHKRLAKYAKLGKSEDQLYDAVVRMQAQGHLSRDISRWGIVLDALDHANVRIGTYNNAKLRRQPRRLSFDTRPSRFNDLSAKDRAAMYQNASQICDNSIGKIYMREVMQNDKADIFFARNIDKTIVSFVIVNPNWDKSHGPFDTLRVAEIDLICAQRGRGMELMKSIINYYALQKYDIVRLEAVERAIKAYHEVGFKTLHYNDKNLLVMYYPISKMSDLFSPAEPQPRTLATNTRDLSPATPSQPSPLRGCNVS